MDAAAGACGTLRSSFLDRFPSSGHPVQPIQLAVVP